MKNIQGSSEILNASTTLHELQIQAAKIHIQTALFYVLLRNILASRR
jgi:hypothetical protein